jgi:hypothetical protein
MVHIWYRIRAFERKDYAKWNFECFKHSKEILRHHQFESNCPHLLMDATPLFNFSYYGCIPRRSFHIYKVVLLLSFSKFWKCNSMYLPCLDLFVQFNLNYKWNNVYFFTPTWAYFGMTINTILNTTKIWLWEEKI